MAQERISGIKINDYPALAAARYDRDRIAMNAAKGVIKEVMLDGYFHADPHPDNLLILPGEVNDDAQLTCGIDPCHPTC